MIKLVRLELVDLYKRFFKWTPFIIVIFPLLWAVGFLPEEGLSLMMKILFEAFSVISFGLAGGFASLIAIIKIMIDLRSNTRYLYFTLPMKPYQIFISKMIASAVIVFVAIVLIELSVLALDRLASQDPVELSVQAVFVHFVKVLSKLFIVMIGISAVIFSSFLARSFQLFRRNVGVFTVIFSIVFFSIGNEVRYLFQVILGGEYRFVGTVFIRTVNSLSDQEQLFANLLSMIVVVSIYCLLSCHLLSKRVDI